MTILTVIAVLVVLYLLIAAGAYVWILRSTGMEMAKAMYGKFHILCLLWPLGLVLWALSEADKEHGE